MSERESKILTISIAAYNVEPYIRQTLDSLIDERIIDDLEIFVVDDGGQDGTLEIAREYAEKYPGSVFPIHKENGGYGSTVNYSVAHATGKYFKLLDGDDWFDSDALYQLVKKLKEINSDIIVTPYHKIESSDSKQRFSFKKAEWGREVPFASLDNKQSEFFPMHSITYKTSTILQSGLTLPEHCLYTDGIFAIVPIAKCKTVYFLDESVYQYRIGHAGQSVERASKIRHKSEFEDVALICSRYYEKMKSQKADNLGYIKLGAMSYCLGAVRCVLLSPINNEMFSELKAFDNKVRETSTDVFNGEECIGKIGRLLAVMRKTGYMPYWLLKLVPGGFPYHP